MTSIKLNGADAKKYFEGTSEKFADWLHSSESNLALTPPLEGRVYQEMINLVDHEAYLWIESQTDKSLYQLEFLVSPDSNAWLKQEQMD